MHYLKLFSMVIAAVLVSPTFQAQAGYIPGFGPEFVLVAKHSGACLRVENNSWGIGTNANIVQDSCDIHPNRWALIPNGDGTVKIERIDTGNGSLTGMCIDVQGAATGPAAGNVWQWDCNGTVGQKWQMQTESGEIVDVDDLIWPNAIYGERFALVNANPNAQTKMCLDVKGGSSDNKANIQVYPCLHGDNHSRFAYFYWSFVNL